MMKYAADNKMMGIPGLERHYGQQHHAPAYGLDKAYQGEQSMYHQPQGMSMAVVNSISGAKI